MPKSTAIPLGTCKVVTVRDTHIGFCDEPDAPAFDLFMRRDGAAIAKAIRPLRGKRYEIELILREAA